MHPEGYRWHDADSRDTPGWWQLLNQAGQVAAKIQPYDGRYWIKVGLDGYAHAVKSGSTVSLERAKAQWSGGRGSVGVSESDAITPKTTKAALLRLQWCPGEDITPDSTIGLHSSGLTGNLAATGT
jgi:hypothetical protein